MRREKYLRLALLAFGIAIGLLMIAYGLGYAAPGTGADAPMTITLQGKLAGVTCLGPCCCGDVSTVYQGHWYGAVYCKWFHLLHDGDVVTVRARRVR